jgi:signal transduction histidine kinase
MERLLKDLLDLSRIGRMVNPFEEIPFGELANEAARLVSGQIAQSGVQVLIAPNLPTVHGDRPRLVEVLQNLIENAVKFMGNQPRPQVEIGATRDGEKPVYYVRDNGIGIDPMYHEKIFGLFERLDGAVEGTGVGLALVSRIVELHGGRIWVESKGIGDGSSFCFTLANRPPKTSTQ